jgi:hypothetical protein
LCGYFVVPYKLLRLGHRAHNGFEFDHDHPKNKRTLYFDWQNGIGCVLHKSGMFPRESNFAQHVKSTDNGFIALLALLSNTHPEFVDQPILLTINWPVQSSTKNIFDYYANFLTTSIFVRSLWVPLTACQVPQWLIVSSTTASIPLIYSKCLALIVKIPASKVSLPQVLSPLQSIIIYPTLIARPSNWLVLYKERERDRPLRKHFTQIMDQHLPSQSICDKATKC